MHRGHCPIVISSPVKTFCSFLAHLRTYHKHSKCCNERVSLDVGGVHYVTTLEMLTAVPGSLLADSFQGDWRLARNASGDVFLDRNGEASSAAACQSHKLRSA